MSGRKGLHFVVLVISACKVVSQVHNQDQMSYYNVFESSIDNVLVKSGSLLSNFTIKHEEDCQLKCLENKNCLSMNVIPLSGSGYLCEVFNWGGADFKTHLVSKPGAKFLQVQSPCFPNPCQNGGQCTLKDEVTNYTCTCAASNHYGRTCQNKKCILFDFETGRLDGWGRTGTAFNNQPTYGDNPKARARETSNHKGNWWIGGYENRPSPSHPAGAFQGDGPTGTLTSPKFEIIGSNITFLIGGGKLDSERIELLIGGSVIDKAISSVSLETMTTKSFDVSNYRGKIAQVQLVDGNTESWGHINIDHVQDNCV